MEQLTLNPPLSNVQAELLKLFAANVPDDQLLEIKDIVAKYLLGKARDRADELWDEKGYNDEALQALLNGK